METVGACFGCFRQLVGTKASSEWDWAVLTVSSLAKSKTPGPRGPLDGNDRAEADCVFIYTFLKSQNEQGLT